MLCKMYITKNTKLLGKYQKESPKLQSQKIKHITQKDNNCDILDLVQAFSCVAINKLNPVIKLAISLPCITV